MQHILENVLTEDRVEKLLSSFLQEKEDFTFIGQAFHRFMDTNYYNKRYYVGKTKGTGIIAEFSYKAAGIKNPKRMLLQAFEEYIEGEWIEVVPFMTPPLAMSKDREFFQCLKDTVEKYLSPEESFVTLCRAYKYMGFQHFLIALTNERILRLKIKSKTRIEVKGSGSYSLSDLAEMSIPLARALEKVHEKRQAPIRAPLIDAYGGTLLIRLNNGDTFKYTIATVRGHSTERYVV